MINIMIKNNKYYLSMFKKKLQPIQLINYKTS